MNRELQILHPNMSVNWRSMRTLFLVFPYNRLLYPFPTSLEYDLQLCQTYYIPRNRLTTEHHENIYMIRESIYKKMK